MITVNDLHYQYGLKRKIFTGLNLTLESAKIYGILGRNGAGKSTLLKCLCGLLIPRSGIIKIGTYTAQDRLPSFLSDLYFLPEEISSPDVSPEEYGRTFGVFYPGYDHTFYISLCKEFEIPMQHRLDEMSYGQKKKTLISFGIACNTKVIILDEPTNGLDIPSKSQFRKILAKSTNQENCILISTHQIKDVENLIDHVIILNEGGILFNQSISSISQTLYFTERGTIEPNDQRIYEEESIHGYTVIEPNTGTKETKIDLEILYNAVMQESNSIQQLFK